MRMVIVTNLDYYCGKPSCVVYSTQIGSERTGWDVVIMEDPNGIAILRLCCDTLALGDLNTELRLQIHF